MNSPQPDRPFNHVSIARQVRGVFVEQATRMLGELSTAIAARLSTLFEQSTNARESQDRRDAMIVYQQGSGKWMEGTDRAWKSAAQSDLTASSTRLPALSLELIGNEVVESKILSARLAMRMLDKSGFEFSDLQVRMRMLEDKEELDKGDILRPEACAQLMLEQWLAAGLPQSAWLTVQDVIQQNFADKIGKVYKACNEFLIAQGVMKEIDLRSNLRRAPNAKATPAAAKVDEAAEASGSSPLQSDQSFAPTAFGRAAASLAPIARPTVPPTGAMSKAGRASSQVASHIAKLRAQAAEYAAQQAALQAAQQVAMPSGSSGLPALTPRGMFADTPDGMTASPQPSRSMGSPMSSASGARPGRSAVHDYIAQAEAEETRMQTAATPLARARMRAQGVMGQLKQMLVQRVEGFDDTRAPQMSPGLLAAMTPRPGVRRPGYQRTQQGGAHTVQGQSAMMDGPIYAGVSAQIVEGMQAGQVRHALKEQTKDLKKAASTDGEKATIEIVALMFQSILAEERIPTNVRVWFARLQMPVLRLALSEAEFFGTTQHPARRLIDRMGSCVLGFDANVGSVELEAEIKRIVQTIEQYPETGRRVFQLVFDEFEKFLSKFLTGGKSTAKVVTLAQQVEQKETAAIQYTIELRKMLGNLPMRDEIREFLFKVWAEVLAVGAMKHGPKDEKMLELKKVATDLLWAAGVKQNREDRAKIIAELPDLLKRLRLGMGLLGLAAAVQEAHIKSVSDALAEAFMSKSASLEQSQVAEVAQRIRNLEDFVSEDEVGDLPLDAESIEMTLGIDMTGVEIVSEGGTEPTQAMRAWAMELDRGSWFHLDIKGKMKRVQYSWRSSRGQLFLFADASGLTYLFQVKRLAAYLQAGLITPIEDETLTVRATRAALTKLDANPDRLLAAA